MIRKIEMETLELAKKRIEEAEWSLARGTVGDISGPEYTPAAVVRSWIVRGNLKLAKAISNVSPSVASAQLSLSQKTCETWHKYGRVDKTRSAYGSAESYIEDAKRLLEESKTKKRVTVIT